MSNLFEKIGSVVVSVGLAIGGFFGYVPEQSYVEVPVEEESLGADTVLPIAGMTFYLSGTGISSSATSFTLTSLTVTQNGKKITDSELSDIFYITLEPGSRTRQEIISCTAVVQNADGTATISGCTRGLAPITPYTASTTLQFAHAGGSIAIFSNPPQLYNQVAVKDNDETITGSWLFPTPVAGTNPATKDYVLSVVTGGTVSYDQIVVAGLAGETVATGTIVYLAASDSRWYKADNDLSYTYIDQTIGVTQGNGTAGNNVQGGILTYGLDSTQTGMTGGNYIFLSATVGATSTATTSQILGKAISATTMFFDPNLIDSSVYFPITFTSTTSITGILSVNATSTGDFGSASTTIFSSTGSSTYTKSTSRNLRYIIIEGIGGGANSNVTVSGGGGGYFRKLINASSLSATTSVFVGNYGCPAEDTKFGSFATGYGGCVGGARQDGGTAIGGDLNIQGGDGIQSGSGGTGGNYGVGGQSFWGSSSASFGEPQGYGAGASGENGGGAVAGTQGLLIITEYF